jgi:hypothetical protein
MYVDYMICIMGKTLCTVNDIYNNRQSSPRAKLVREPVQDASCMEIPHHFLFLSDSIALCRMPPLSYFHLDAAVWRCGILLLLPIYADASSQLSSSAPSRRFISAGDLIWFHQVYVYHIDVLASTHPPPFIQHR